MNNGTQFQDHLAFTHSNIHPLPLRPRVRINSMSIEQIYVHVNQPSWVLFFLSCCARCFHLQSSSSSHHIVIVIDILSCQRSFFFPFPSLMLCNNFCSCILLVNRPVSIIHTRDFASKVLCLLLKCNHFVQIEWQLCLRFTFFSMDWKVSIVV